MFRATMCPLSAELTVFMRHLVFVTLCRWLSGMQGGIHPAYKTVHLTAVHHFVRTHKELPAFLQYLCRVSSWEANNKFRISSKLFVRCGGGGGWWIWNGWLGTQTAKENNIIKNGLKIWVVMLRIKSPCPGTDAEKRFLGDISQMFIEGILWWHTEATEIFYCIQSIKQSTQKKMLPAELTQWWMKYCKKTEWCVACEVEIALASYSNTLWLTCGPEKNHDTLAQM